MTRTLPDASTTLLARIRGQIAGERPDWEGIAQPAAVPVGSYVSEEIWRAEIERLFRPLPLIVAHGSELGPGEVLAHDSYGVPLLLTRTADGVVHAHLNVCRHRGMRLVEAGLAAGRRALACPYHAWTYGLDGAFRGMPQREAFDPCPAGTRDLVRVPCAERHGLIWAMPTPGEGPLDIEAWLGGLDAELAFADIPGLRLYRKIEAEYPANWKLIMDAFLEAYHIQVLHKATIAPFFIGALSAAAHFGPHQHALVARKAMEAWARNDGLPPSSFDVLRQLTTPTQTIFPNTVTIHQPDYLSLVTLYPVGPDRFHWTHRMLVPADKMTPDWDEHWGKTLALVDRGVFEAEDIGAAVAIQKGFASSANTHLTLGRMEANVARFHDEVERHLAS